MLDIAIKIDTMGFSILDVMHGCDEGITHIYAAKSGKLFSIVAPHSGTDGRYMLRIDSEATHDRWSNCEQEHFYFTPTELLMTLHEF